MIDIAYQILNFTYLFSLLSTHKILIVKNYIGILSNDITITNMNIPIISFELTSSYLSLLQDHTKIGYLYSVVISDNYKNPTEIFEDHENIINTYAKTMYERRYIIIYKKYQQRELQALFASQFVHHVLEIFVVKEDIDKFYVYVCQYANKTIVPKLLTLWHKYSPNKNEDDISKDAAKYTAIGAMGRIQVGLPDYYVLESNVKCMKFEQLFFEEYGRKYNLEIIYDQDKEMIKIHNERNTSMGLSTMFWNNTVDVIGYRLHDYGIFKVLNQFTKSVYYVNYKCIVLKPTDTTVWLLYYIFTESAWIFLAFSISIMGILLFLLDIYNLKFKGIRNNNNYLIIYRMILGQSISESFYSNNKRLLMGVLHFTLLIINTYVVAKISSYSGFTVYENEINTLQELADSNIPIYSLNKNDLLRLKYETKEPYRTIYLRHKEQQLISEEEFGNRIENNDNFAYIIDIDSRNWFINILYGEPNILYSEFKLINEVLLEKFLGFYLRRNSVFGPTLNKFITMINEAGLDMKWQQRAKFNTNSYGILRQADTYAYELMTLVHYRPGFMLLIFGYILSVIALLIEILIYQRRVTRITRFIGCNK